MEMDLERLRNAVDRAGGAVDASGRARALAEELRTVAGLGVLVDTLAEICDRLEAQNRQLELIGFDLHDGPLQSLIAMRADVHLFRGQLASVTAGNPNAARLVGRVDDLFARASDIEADLRALAQSTRGSPLNGSRLSDALAETVDLYSDPCSIELDFEPGVDTADLTEGQRITAVRVVQSALANVVQHSGAKAAIVSVRSAADGVEIEIVDEGKGFDVGEAMRRAAATGRMGLAGMEQRALLYGGRLEIESPPTGTTRVRLWLPVGRPDPDR